MIDKTEYQAELLKALGHPTRLCIIKGLLKNECNVSYMVECLNVPQPTISQHLKVLKGAGIIRNRRDGHEMKYCIINDSVKKIIKALE